MANTGPNTNNSQFMITFNSLPWLNNKNVVFGQVIDGFNVMKAIENRGTDTGKPTTEVFITNSGQIPL